MFRRPQTVGPATSAEIAPLPVTPASQELLSCGTDTCRQVGRLACYEEGAEVLYEDLVAGAEVLVSEHASLERYASMLKHGWFEDVEQHQLALRNDRRAFRRTREQEFANLSKGMQSTANTTMAHTFGEAWEALPSTIQSEGQLQDLLRKITKSERTSTRLFNNPSPLQIELYSIHAKLALVQLRARSQLGYLFAQAPAYSASVFAADRLAGLPPALQKLVAVDVSKGNDSVILGWQQRQKQPNPAELPFAERLSNYLSKGMVPKDVKIFLQGLQVGAASMQAATCPFNEFGLCEAVLQRVNISQLPSQLLADMVRREEQDSQTTLSQYGKFAQSVNLGLFDPDARTVGSAWQPTDSGPVDISTKRRQVSKPDSHDEPVVVENDAAPFVANVHVRLPGGAQFEADPNDPASFDELITQLLATKIVANYMRKHNFDGMEDFMRKCLGLILNPQTASETRGIKPIVNSSPIFWDDIPLRKFELSVQQVPGLQGNKTARDTRVLFGQGGAGSSRHIILLDIHQKETVQKRNLTRGSRVMG